MQSNSYLYGEDTEVPEIPQEVIVRRVEALNDHLEELLAVPYEKRDSLRVHSVIKARNFWLNINEKEI